MVRGDEELREARRALFEALPQSHECKHLLAFQRRIVQEILSSEAELKNGADVRAHLHMVRLYGDALAFQWLSVYALRQLRRNKGAKPPHLSGQGKGFDLALDSCALLNENGAPAILCDITNVLKNGDVVVCADPDLPVIFECKASGRPPARFERQGRRGRQLSRIESIGNFLVKGEGKLFGDQRYRQTAVIKNVPEYEFGPVEKTGRSALEHHPSVLVPNEFQLYSAAILGEAADFSDKMSGWNVQAEERVMIAAASEPMAGGWADIRPPVLWDLSTECRWALMEGDVSLLHAVRANALVGVSRGEMRVLAAVETPQHCEAETSWVYELSVAGDQIFISPSVLFEIAYGHETLESARRRFLDMAEAATSIHTADPEGTGEQ